jgi:glycosyltransferase involved in cell wall biosynthesis
MSSAPASVLLVTPRWARDGGVAAHVKASAELLASQGLSVSVLAAQIEDVVSDGGGVSVHHSPALFDAHAPEGERFGAALASLPEVIHLHQVDDPAIVSALRASAPVLISVHGYSACTSGVYYFAPGQECTRAHGLGCIPQLTLHGCAHTRYPKALPAKFRNATRRREALGRADLLLSYSGAVDRHLAANGLRERAVIPLFATVPVAKASGHESRRRVLFAGRIVPAKGLDVLLRAACEVDCELVVCGAGRQLNEMRELAHSLGLGGRVSFAGWLDEHALARELADASVVAIPSLWPEPFGLVGIEALAAGRPVVASATGGIMEWLDDGVSGLMVPPGDARALARALEELLEDTERQRVMGEAGRRAVGERFSPQRHVEALLAAYTKARASWSRTPA